MRLRMTERGRYFAPASVWGNYAQSEPASGRRRLSLYRPVCLCHSCRCAVGLEPGNDSVLVAHPVCGLFFRNPDRTIPQGDQLVVAPADGTVVFTDVIKEERFFGEEMLKISIFMSLLNVHVNRVPCSGSVIDQYYSKGQFFNASLDKSSLENEQGGMVIEAPSGHKVLVVQIAGLIARRIVTYPVIGDVLERGQRYGLIRFGSRVDIYLPKETQSEIRLGDQCVAGETVLGQLQ